MENVLLGIPIPNIMFREKRSLTFATVAVVFLFLLQSVSADRSDATEETILIDTDDADVTYLLTEQGTTVKIWIDEIDGVDGADGHAIDVYIATWDQWWDHFCGGEGNQFAEDFTPAYVQEDVEVVSGQPLYIEWTAQTDDDYYLLFDNCDNQRTTDYKDDVSSIIITYAVDDLSDEIGEGILAFLGGSMLVCCGLPLLLTVLIIILLFRRKKEVIVIQQQ